MKPITPKFPKLLHGGDYNPEQWLRYPEVLKQDIELMKKADINCVSVGIFSWAHLEPEEGVYTFDWLAEIIDNLYANGIYTVLATPSGAKPLWMSEKYEEIRRVQPNGVRDLSGARHNHCYTSPVYREKVREIDRRLAERFANHPGVILWHLSNEYGGECYCPLCQEAFRGWLRAKYKTLDNLNHAWWTDFWSHTYTDWAQIHAPVPNGEMNVHGLTLDWKRFVTHQTVDFMTLERDTVKAVNPDIPVTANLMGFYDGLDYFKFGPALDVVSWDNYPQWHTTDNTDVAVFSALSHDVMRSVKHENFLLMESTPSMTNWSPVSMLKRPGMHLLSSMQAVAHGSNSVQYFQFRKSRGSCEKLHGAVVDHVGNSGPYDFVRTENTRVFKDVQLVGAQLKAMNDRGDVYSTEVRPEVAIVYDVENRWAIDAAAGPRNIGKKYVETLVNHYRPFWEQGVQVDIVDMDGDISGYKLVIAPMLYMYRAGFEQKMRAFVENGGTLVTTYWSGIADETDLCFLGGAPGGMMDVFGVWNEEIDGLPDGMLNSIAVNGKSYTAMELCARIHPITAEVLGTYEKDFYAGEPALTKNAFGKGTAYYLAARTGVDFLRDFYGEQIRALAVSRALETELPRGVTAHLRQNETGGIIFVENYSDSEKTVDLGGKYKLYGTDQTVNSIKLAPFGITLLSKLTKI
ncbi:MAG: beta-galactosidase [Hominenteromicrobium sp.]